jgi:hypothetical protein
VHASSPASGSLGNHPASRLPQERRRVPILVRFGGSPDGLFWNFYLKSFQNIFLKFLFQTFFTFVEKFYL